MVASNRQRSPALTHGTTVGTNAVVQDRLADIGMITTLGFRDVLELGRQRRPHLYDLDVPKPRPLAPRRLRLEVSERINALGRVQTPIDMTDLECVVRRPKGERRVGSGGLLSTRLPELHPRATSSRRAATAVHEHHGQHLLRGGQGVPRVREVRHHRPERGVAARNESGTWTGSGGGSGAWGYPTGPASPTPFGGIVSFALQGRGPWTPCSRVQAPV